MVRLLPSLASAAVTIAYATAFLPDMAVPAWSYMYPFNTSQLLQVLSLSQPPPTLHANPARLAQLREQSWKFALPAIAHRHADLIAFLSSEHSPVPLAQLAAFAFPLYNSSLNQLNLSSLTFLHEQAYHRSILLALAIVSLQVSQTDTLHLQLSDLALLDPTEHALYTGNRASAAHSRRSIPHVTSSSLPASFDLRNSTLMPPVKNQLACGDCWVYSALGAMEIQNIFQNHLINSGQLSEQQLLSCSQGSTGLDACRGGSVPNAWNWIFANGGLDSDVDYPFTGRERGWNATFIPPCQVKVPPPVLTTNVSLVPYIQCSPSSCPGMVQFPSLSPGATSAKILDLEMLIFDSIWRGVPVVLNVAAGSPAFSYYSSGLLGESCNFGQNRSMHVPIDHSVIAVGWTPSSIIVRNAWGTTWGEKGYAELQRGIAGGACRAYENGGFALKAVISLVPITKAPSVRPTKSPTPPVQRPSSPPSYGVKG